MNPWKVQIKKNRAGGYIIYVWETGEKPGDVHRVENEDELVEFLRGLYG